MEISHAAWVESRKYLCVFQSQVVEIYKLRVGATDHLTPSTHNPGIIPSQGRWVVLADDSTGEANNSGSLGGN
jgi:hypothetical protein